MIRSSKISTAFANTGKKETLTAFLSEYAAAIDFYIDKIWNMTYEYTSNKGIKHTWDVSNNKYDLPVFCPITEKPITDLSARALKCAMTQAMGIVKSAVTKWVAKRYVVSKKQKTQHKSIRKLQSWVDKHPPAKPHCDRIEAELGSICLSYIPNKTTKFDGFIVLSSIGKKYGKIRIPIKMTAHSNSLLSKGKLMASFLVSENNICFRYQIDVKSNSSTIMAGGDIGQTTVLTLSDGNITNPCRHGHDLKSINNKMSRKQKGSKAYQRAKDHSINYINWSIKQLNLPQYGKIQLENNKHIKRGKRTSKSLMAWSWSTIYKSIMNVCEEHGVRVELQASAYKSQRCYSCGYVHKSNRSGKLFRCRHCGYTDDADMNGARNNSIKLFVISRGFMAGKHNRFGFFWDRNGLFSDKERTVPYIKKE